MAGLTLAELRQRLAINFMAETTEIDRAINDAIRSIRGEMLYMSEDESITLVDNEYEYDLSGISGLTRIRQIWQEEIDGEFTTPIPRHFWQVIVGPTLVFFPWYFFPMGGQSLRILGQARQADLSAGADVLNIDEEYVIAKARAYLHSNRANPVGPDNVTVNPAAEYHTTMMAYWSREARTARLESPYRVLPNSISVPNAV